MAVPAHLFASDGYDGPWPHSCGATSVVDCWIGIVQEAGRRIVHLAGRLGEEQVPELLQACAPPGVLQLDLSDLVSADAAGVDVLRRMQASGASLVGVPGYIQLKLDSTSRAALRHAR